MSANPSSYRQIVRAVSIIGGATVVSLLFGLLRNKVVALLLGPEGIGLFGLLNALFTTAASLIGFNLSSSGVRQIAAAPSGSAQRHTAQAALWSLTWLLAVLGSFGFWIYYRLAYATDAAPADWGGVPWLAIAVALNTVGAAQLVILQADERIGDLARVKLYGTILSVIAGVAAVALLALQGVVLAVVAMPLANLLIAHIYLRRSGRQRPNRVAIGAHLAEWRVLIGLGLTITLTGLIGNAAQLLLRSMLVKWGSLDAAGQFQAAWSIASINLSVILSAMAVDYFPRLSRVSDDASALAALANQQLRVALMLSGPLLILLVALAPIVVPILYSHAFAQTVPLLQLQLAGDVLKLISWTLGYVLLARRAGATYVAAESMFSAVLIAATWIAFPAVGLLATGLGYIVAMAAAAGVSLVATRRLGVCVNRENLLIACGLFGGLVVLGGLAHLWPWVGGGIGCFGAALFALLALRELRRAGVTLPRRFVPGFIARRFGLDEGAR